jgi:DNA-binding GntR family transcriptional regulator
MLMESPDMHLAPTEQSRDLLLYRIRGEYLEMPGLRLTLEQAARLWQMDTAICAAALMQLIADGFLTRTQRGAYVRMDQA